MLQAPLRDFVIKLLGFNKENIYKKKYNHKICKNNNKNKKYHHMKKLKKYITCKIWKTFIKCMLMIDPIKKSN